MPVRKDMYVLVRNYLPKYILLHSLILTNTKSVRGVPEHKHISSSVFYKICTSVNCGPTAHLGVVYETRRAESRTGVTPHPVIFYRLLVKENPTLRMIISKVL